MLLLKLNVMLGHEEEKISNDYDRNTALTELELELLWKLGDISILSSLGELTAGSSDP